MSNKHVNSEAGFTLIELLVASAMMVVITGAAVTMLISVMHRQPAVSNGADQIGSARNAMETMTAGLRKGEAVTSASPYNVMVTEPCSTSKDGECSVGYSCGPEAGATTWECVTENSDGTDEKLLSGLAEPERVFCFYPTYEEEGGKRKECGEAGNLEAPTEAPTYVGITLQFPQENNEEQNTTFEGGVALHNASSVLRGTASEPLVVE